jgi:hypothetical protein
MKCLNENGLKKLVNVLEEKLPGISNLITIDGNKLKIVGSLDAYVVIPGQSVIEAVVVPQPGEAPASPGDLTKAALEKDPEATKSAETTASKIPPMQQQYNALFNAINATHKAEIQGLKSRLDAMKPEGGQPGVGTGAHKVPQGPQGTQRPFTPAELAAKKQEKPGQKPQIPPPVQKPQVPTPEELAAKRQMAAAKGAAATIRAAGNTQLTTDVYESVAKGFKA